MKKIGNCTYNQQFNKILLCIRNATTNVILFNSGRLSLIDQQR